MNPYRYDHATLVIRIVMYSLITFALVFSIPVTLLLIVHTKNFMAGKPSPQNIKKKKSDNEDEDLP